MRENVETGFALEASQSQADSARVPASSERDAR